MRELGCIVAMGKNRVIALNGDLPWYEPIDLKFFKDTTMGHAVLLGRKTYASMDQPLSGRRNLVLSRQKDLQLEGYEVFSDPERMLEAAYQTDDFPYVIGGSAVYAYFLPRVTRLLITWIPYEGEGDTFFPEWNEDEWSVVSSREIEGRQGSLHFVEFKRVSDTKTG
ncbi:MAG: dihydrofolate reductase [Myxococcota bacterium]